MAVIAGLTRNPVQRSSGSPSLVRGAAAGGAWHGLILCRPPLRFARSGFAGPRRARALAVILASPEGSAQTLPASQWFKRTSLPAGRSQRPRPRGPAAPQIGPARHRLPRVNSVGDRRACDLCPALLSSARGARAMVLPLTAPRWVGGSGARAQGPFAPGGQWITLPVIRVEAVQHHDRRYRERDPGERAPGPPAQPPRRTPHSRTNATRHTSAGLDCG